MPSNTQLITLTDHQATALNYLSANAFVKIHHIASDSAIEDSEKVKSIDRIAQGFHNLPWMVAEDRVNPEKLLKDLMKAGKAYYDRAYDILHSA